MNLVCVLIRKEKEFVQFSRSQWGVETHKSVEWKLKRDATIVPLEMVRFLVQEEEVDLYHLGNRKEYCFSITCAAKKPNTQKKNAGNFVLAFCMMFNNELLSNKEHLIAYIFFKKTLCHEEKFVNIVFGVRWTNVLETHWPHSNKNLFNLFAGLFVVCK